VLGTGVFGNVYRRGKRIYVCAWLALWSFGSFICSVVEDSSRVARSVSMAARIGIFGLGLSL
jgi:hypothetical protein